MGNLSPAATDCDTGEDRISGLPDDILMMFISRMGMKEAARTSILSKQWRYLWAKSTHLDFNHLIILPNVICLYVLARAKKKKYIKKYINWVNQVVNLHCNPWINTFRVCFDFDSIGSNAYAHHIDKWVKFAISKRVENLELNLKSEKPLYALTFDVLNPSLDVNGSGIRFLQSLHLKNVNVSEDILEYLLSECRFLERLHVECSDTLLRLKVVGLCNKLTHLTILHCDNLKEVDIEAVNLVYLRYGSYGIKDNWSNVVFKNMPNLVEARFDVYYVSDFTLIFQQNSHLTQISKLSLINFYDMKYCEDSAGNLPTFCNLKQLTIMADNGLELQLASINQFLNACPKLREFKVEIENWDYDYLEEEDYYQLNVLDSSTDDVEIEMTRDWEYFESTYNMEIERTGHPNLKEIQVAGFRGWNLDVDLIMFLVLISCNLETIICDCSHRDIVVKDVVVEVSKSRAAKLVKLIPPKISLVIM